MVDLPSGCIQIMYNERKNELGLWAEGWNVVLVSVPVAVAVAGKLQWIRHETGDDMLQNWISIAEF